MIRRLVYAVALFLLVGLLTWQARQMRNAPPPELSRVFSELAQIERPLRSACSEAARVMNPPPRGPEGRGRAAAALEGVRSAARQAARAFRAVRVPPGPADARMLLRKALAAKARMAALSEQAAGAGLAALNGRQGAAARRMRTLETRANEAGREAHALLRRAAAAFHKSPIEAP